MVEYLSRVSISEKCPLYNNTVAILAMKYNCNIVANYFSNAE